MNRVVDRHQIAKWSLGFVMLVIFVCSGQNSGIVPSCPLNAHNAIDLSASDSSSTQIKTTDADKHCELSDHLLQLHQLSFDPSYSATPPDSMCIPRINIPTHSLVETSY